MQEAHIVSGKLGAFDIPSGTGRRSLDDALAEGCGTPLDVEAALRQREAENSHGASQGNSSKIFMMIGMHVLRQEK